MVIFSASLGSTVHREGEKEGGRERGGRGRGEGREREMEEGEGGDERLKFNLRHLLPKSVSISIYIPGCIFLASFPMQLCSLLRAWHCMYTSQCKCVHMPPSRFPFSQECTENGLFCMLTIVSVKCEYKHDLTYVCMYAIVLYISALDNEGSGFEK